MDHRIQAGFKWRFRQFDGDTLVSCREVRNLIPKEGLNYLVAATLKGAAQRHPWYCGVFEGDYTPDEDTSAATIVAAATECLAYAGATRPQIVFGDVANGSADNAASKIELVFSADKTIHGGFISSSPVKGGDTGILISAARTGPEVVKAGRRLVIDCIFSLYSAA